MFDVTDIFRSIMEMLEANFSDIPVENSDIKNPPRPSFYINFLDEKDSKTAASYTNEKYSFDVIYFGKSNKKFRLELLEIQAKLKNLFLKPLSTEKDGKRLFFDIISAEYNRNNADGVLNALIDFDLTQGISDEFNFDYDDGMASEETMDELQV